MTSSAEEPSERSPWVYRAAWVVAGLSACDALEDMQRRIEENRQRREEGDPP